MTLSRILRTTSLFVLLLAQGNPVVAQTGACSDLLKFGIYDQYSVLNTSSYVNVFHDVFCNTDIHNASDADNVAAQAKIPIDDIYVGLGFAKNSAHTDQEWHQACSMTDSNVSSNYFLWKTVRTISPALMQVVNKCLMAQKSGFVAWIETTQDRTQLKYYARYFRAGEGDKAKIKNFSIAPVEIANRCKNEQPNEWKAFKPGNEIAENPLPLVCSVDPATTITVSLATTRSGIDANSSAITLDGEKPETPPNPPPVTVDQNYVIAANGYCTPDGNWFSTGLWLPASTKLNISSSGSACLTPNGNCAGPDGDPANQNQGCVNAHIVCGALYGKIGPSGSPFLVGISHSNTTDAAGDLYLAYGDTDCHNNSGSLSVSVDAVEPSTHASLTPGHTDRIRILDRGNAKH